MTRTKHPRCRRRHGHPQRVHGCPARFLITQSSSFEQPPATRIGVLDAVCFLEKLLDERRCPRRCVDPSFLGRFVNRFFELLLLLFWEFSFSPNLLSISNILVEWFVGVEPLGPAIDRPSTGVVPLGKFGLRDTVFVRNCG